MVEPKEEGLEEILAEVRRIDVLSRRLATDVMAGGYRSVFRGAGIEFDSVREYAEGDDPRAVDWNVTARMGRPFVKTYVDERELTLVFLVDVSASTEGGFGIWSVRQTAARVLACLGLTASNNGDKVGMLAFSGQVDAWVEPAKGVGHVLRIVRDCLVLEGRGAGSAIGSALEMASRTLRRRAILFVVSDFLSSGWEAALRLSARRHDVIAVRLLTPELDALPRGIWRLRDPESGRLHTLDTRRPAVRGAWAERVRAWREATERALARAKVDLMDVPVPQSPGKDLVARPILDFFRMRELRGAKR